MEFASSARKATKERRGSQPDQVNSAGSRASCGADVDLVRRAREFGGQGIGSTFVPHEARERPTKWTIQDIGQRDYSTTFDNISEPVRSDDKRHHRRCYFRMTKARNSNLHTVNNPPWSDCQQ